MELVKWPFLKQTWGIEFERSAGAYLYTKDGRKILDAAGGAIVSNIGSVSYTHLTLPTTPYV